MNTKRTLFSVLALFLFVFAAPSLAGRGLRLTSLPQATRHLLAPSISDASASDADGWGVQSVNRDDTDLLFDNYPTDPKTYLIPASSDGTTPASFDFPKLLTFIDNQGDSASAVLSPLSSLVFLGNLWEAAQAFLGALKNRIGFGGVSPVDLESTESFLTGIAINIAEGKISTIVNGPTPEYTATIKSLQDKINTLQTTPGSDKDTLQLYQDQLAELQTPEAITQNSGYNIHKYTDPLPGLQKQIDALEVKPPPLSDADSQTLANLKSQYDGLRDGAIVALKSLASSSAAVDKIPLGINKDWISENGITDLSNFIFVVKKVSDGSAGSQFIREQGTDPAKAGSYIRPGQEDQQAAENQQQQQMDTANQQGEEGEKGTDTDPTSTTDLPADNTTEGNQDGGAQDGGALTVETQATAGESEGI